MKWVVNLVALVLALLLVSDGASLLVGAGIVLTVASVWWSPFVFVSLALLALVQVLSQVKVRPTSALGVPYGGYTRAELLRTSRPHLQDEPTPQEWAALDRTGRIMGFVGELVGVRLQPTNVYRSDALNSAIPGASSTSDHVHGEAWDVMNWSGDPWVDANTAADVLERAGIEWDQLIAYPDRGHVHFGFGGRLRKQVFISRD